MLNTFHDDFENFVEFIGWKPFDVLGAGMEVPSHVGEDGEMGVDGGCIALEDFKLCFSGKLPETK